MKILTASQAKDMDLQTIKKGISEDTLIEQAAYSVFEVVAELRPLKVLCVAGAGNNGADSICTARILANNSIYADILPAAPGKNKSSGYIKQMEIAQNFNVNIVEDKDTDYDSYDIIVDGITGTGFKGPMDTETVAIVDKINNSRATVIAIDIPTGIDSDTALADEHAIFADITVTFSAVKIGHLLYPGCRHCGRIKVADISFDKSYFQNVMRYLVTADTAKALLPRRYGDSNKYSYGRVLVLASSRLYPGAGILNAIGAFRSGAGLVKLITPSDSSDVLSHEPGIIYRQLNKPNFEISDLKEVEQDIKNSDVVLIGSGMGRNCEDFIKGTFGLLTPEQKIVTDADAIAVINSIQTSGLQIIITPHTGEMQRIYKNLKNNVFEVEEYAASKNITVMLKDSVTVITDSKKTYINTLGSSALSKGGSGDLLAGITAGFAAQGLDLLQSAVLASYVTYKTAALLAQEMTEYSVSPLLIANNIYKALKELSEK